MSEQGWTPGPWMVTRNNVEGAIVSALAPGDNLLGLDPDGYAVFVKPEDAQLAAAAPALYAALEAMLESLETWHENAIGSRCDGCIDCETNIPQARAALLAARPKGE